MTAIERELGTRYTIDTLRALRTRYRKREFLWLMGSDNLLQFHKWKAWRDIARTMPIAVVARPGYDAGAVASPATAWLRGHTVSPAAYRRGDGSVPTLVKLHFDPDPRSATAIRRTDPDWADSMGSGPLFDQVTHRRIFASAETEA